MLKLLSFLFFFIFLPGMLSAQTNDTIQWNADADRASSSPYLSAFEKEVIKEINKARLNPALYANLYIEPLLKNFRGNLNTETNVETREGVSAVKECIRVLKKATKNGVEEPSNELHETSAYHTSRQSKTTEVGHTSPDGKTFADRIRKLKFPASAECISYGEATARGVVMALLIDDGVADRGHRKNVLDPRFNLIGVSSGGHKKYNFMSTLDFAMASRNK